MNALHGRDEIVASPQDILRLRYVGRGIYNVSVSIRRTLAEHPYRLRTYRVSRLGSILNKGTLSQPFIPTASQFANNRQELF